MNNSIKITDITELCQSHCKIKHPDRVETLLNHLISGGPNKLQLVSDFDFTITKQHLSNGNKMASSFCILDQCKSLPSTYREENQKLLQKYRPIEIDPHIPRADKIRAMIEWWTLSSALLKGLRLDPNEIIEVAKSYKDDCIRDGTHDMFSDLCALNIPILVFSAGLGDSVLAVLEESQLKLPNVKIVSNFLTYNDGVLTGFDIENMIHTFNKNETVLRGTDYYDLVHDRTHIIVMGDSLGDADMANGSPSTAHILKIGFLYEHIEAHLPMYMDTFDIVLVDDQTMNVPRAILALITSTLNN